MVLNGTAGARLRVGFPVLNRSSFGFWFGYFSVVSRVVLAMVWFGIQTYTGSEYVYQVGHVPTKPNHILLLTFIPTKDVEGYMAQYPAFA